MISSRGFVDRMCHSGSLSDHENVRGGLACEVSGPRGKVSLESVSWRRETYLIYRRCKLLYETEVIVIIICTTQREILATS